MYLHYIVSVKPSKQEFQNFCTLISILVCCIFGGFYLSSQPAKQQPMLRDMYSWIIAGTHLMFLLPINTQLTYDTKCEY